VTALVVDTSAAVAILAREPGADELVAALEQSDRRVMSAATLVELGIVFEARHGPAGRGIVERFLRDADVDVIDLDGEGAELAMDGWRRFGRGRHPAALNFGDCFTYGLAIATAGAVLCTGNDFAATDLEVVRPSSA
jgi:ribonuclease VapC